MRHAANIFSRFVARWFRPFAICAALALGLSVGGYVLFAVAQDHRPDPYALSAEMRSRIDDLKKDVRRYPTSAATLGARVQIVWAWANYLSLRGVTLPPMLPSDMTSMRRRNLSAEAVLAMSAKLDDYIYELALKEEEPRALGELAVETSGPLLIDEYVTLTQTYTVGDKAIEPGGTIVVAQHMFMPPASRFQRDDPKADNYITVTSSNPAITFKPTFVTIAGTFGAFRSARGQPSYEVSGGTLKPGDWVRITYGDTSQGSRGHLLQKLGVDLYPLPIFISFSASQPAVFLPLAPLAILGNKVASVHAFAPSIVAVGEKISISIRSEDKNLNRATGAIPAYDVFLNGTLYRKIPAGDQAITVLENIRFEKPGVYRFAIRSADGAIKGVANPILVETNPGERIYWGETHAHSGMAEGQGTSKALFRYGYEDARLDFLVHSEHDIHLDDAEWEELRRNTQSFYRPGEFITYLGYEWSISVSDGGHHNVIFRTSEHRERVPAQTHPVLSRLYQGLRAQNDSRDILVIPHAHNAGDWRQSDPELENLIEISSLHGNFEWFGKNYVNNGHQVGFIAASDDHFSHPGYPVPMEPAFSHLNGLAAVMAPKKSRDDIFDAMKNGSAYATTGKRIILKASLNGNAMGTRVAFSPRRQIEGRVIGTAPIEDITVIKNGAVVKTWDYAADIGGNSRHFQIEFESQSMPIYDSRDNPRHGRAWRGILRVTGARLVSASMPTAYNPSFEFIDVLEGDANARRFSTTSRGNIKSILVELADITEQARVSIETVEAREMETTPLLYQAPQVLRPVQASFNLAKLKSGTDRLSLPRDNFYTDEIRVRRVNAAPAEERSFFFEENDALRQGDYYYVRVRQRDGALAYSSPFWVGGTRPQ